MELDGWVKNDTMHWRIYEKLDRKRGVQHDWAKSAESLRDQTGHYGEKSIQEQARSHREACIFIPQNRHYLQSKVTKRPITELINFLKALKIDNETIPLE